jgi:hypothetical protein
MCMVSAAESGSTSAKAMSSDGGYGEVVSAASSASSARSCRSIAGAAAY